VTGFWAAGAYQEAMAKGATPDQAFSAYLANLPVGAALALPAHRLLPGGESGSLAARVAKDTIVGVPVMTGQQLAGNLIARNIYDPERDPMAGVGESADAAGIVTAALSALSHGLAKTGLIDTAALNREKLKAILGTMPEEQRQVARTGLQKLNSGLDLTADERSSLASLGILKPVESAPTTSQEVDSIPVGKDYELDPDRRAKVLDVLARQRSGETGTALEAALAGIYADPDLHAFYTLEKDRTQAEQATEPETLETHRTEPNTPIAEVETPDMTQSSAPPLLALAPSGDVSRPTAAEPLPPQETPADPMQSAAVAATVSRQSPSASMTPEMRAKLDQARRAAASYDPDTRFSDRGKRAVDYRPEWQTPEEYADGLSTARMRQIHRQFVERAVSRGDAVPQRVMRYYPDLVPCIRRSASDWKPLVEQGSDASLTPAPEGLADNDPRFSP
jgi:hypothetical protein